MVGVRWCGEWGGWVGRGGWLARVAGVDWEWGRWVYLGGMGQVGWSGGMVWECVGRRGVFVADSVALVIPLHPHHCKVSAKITPETIRLCVRI